MAASDNTNNRIPPIAEDSVTRRLAWAGGVSVLLNLAFLAGASHGLGHPLTDHRDLVPVEMTRVEMTQPKDKRAKPVIRTLAPPPPPKKVAEAPKPKPRDVPPPKQPKPRTAPPPVVRAPRRSAVPPPEGAHNQILVAKAPKGAAPNPDQHTVLAGGNARAGTPLAQQSEGNAATAPPGPTSPSPAPPRATPEPVRVAAAPSPAPTAAAPEPKPEPKPDPKPEPKPSGPTRDAQPDNQVNPDIPDSLKDADFKSFVRVKVRIDADGSFEVVLRTSSGNADVDQRCLDALKRWKWKPALENGVPVASTQLFKFEIEVK